MKIINFIQLEQITVKHDTTMKSLGADKYKSIQK